MNTSEEIDRLLTVNEVAEHWRICTKTVRRMVDRGVLQPVRLSARCVRYRATDVAASLARMSEAGERSMTHRGTI